MLTFAPFYSQEAFQSTHPCGVRHMELLSKRLRCLFQSTHPCGVRLEGKNPSSVIIVSIHAPVWGATAVLVPTINNLCFNPRTRVGCDPPFGFSKSTAKFQSTHPCGVRLINHNAPKRVRGFNPRTRVGCDCHQMKCGQSCPCFNPRTRVGCDILERIVSYFTPVSIHAPVWGATSAVVRLYFGSCFNPRTRVGCDLHLNIFDSSLQFQSTHPCGVRHPITDDSPCHIRFNPRTRVGCDARHGNSNKQWRGFNPRTRVGCDDLIKALQAVKWFQSTHPCGVRHRVYQCRRKRHGFNPRTRVGCDLSLPSFVRPIRFQSTHPCGVRLFI